MAKENIEELKLKIKLLEYDEVIQKNREKERAEHQQKLAAVDKSQALVLYRQEFMAKEMALSAENASLKVKVQQLELRLKESNAEFLKDVMKALLVKFPTMNITDLSVVTKEKK